MDKVLAHTKLEGDAPAFLFRPPSGATFPPGEGILRTLRVRKDYLFPTFKEDYNV